MIEFTLDGWVPGFRLRRRRIHVLHIIAGIHPRDGGPTAALRGIALAQVAQGDRVTLLTTWSSEIEVIMAERLRARGVAVHLVGPKLGLFRSHSDLPRMTRELLTDVDVVHIHGIWEEIQHQAAAACREAGVPYVMRPCGMLDRWCLSNHRLRKAAYLRWRLLDDLNGAAALHFTSAAECEDVSRLGLKPPVIVEPLGVAVSEFAEPVDGREFRQAFGLGEHPYVLFFGRLCRKKGLNFLLRVFSRATLPGYKLVIAGPDSEKLTGSLKSQARRLRIEDRVVFTGLLAGPHRLAALFGASLFVLPSQQENFAIAAAEAMAAGCPALVSDRVALQREILQTGAGWALEMDLNKWAKALTSLGEQPDAFRWAGELSRAYALKAFDWQRIAAGWSDHYEYLGRHRRTIRPTRVSAVRGLRTVSVGCPL